MPKIRLTNAHRDTLRKYGQEKIATLIDRKKEQALYAKLLDGANKTIRTKYPEVDMVVIRKHGLATIDYCLKFQFPSGRVDGFRFDGDSKVNDIPYNRACAYQGRVYPVDAAFEISYDDYGLLKKANDDEQSKRLASFYALVDAAKTLEDVLEVIDLPADVQERLGKKSQALVALSPDTLKSLKKDFAIKKAA